MTINTHDRRYPQFTIGWRLRLARTQLGPEMDAARFADLIGVSRGTVTNYELEKTPADKMRAIVLNAWALATGVDVDWIRTGELPQTPYGPDGGEHSDASPETGNGVLPVTRWLQLSQHAESGVAAA
jgi:transcriptional regulator with XRE-family HTH domain